MINQIKIILASSQTCLYFIFWRVNESICHECPQKVSLSWNVSEDLLRGSELVFFLTTTVTQSNPMLWKIEMITLNTHNIGFEKCPFSRALMYDGSRKWLPSQYLQLQNHKPYSLYLIGFENVFGIQQNWKQYRKKKEIVQMKKKALKRMKILMMGCLFFHPFFHFFSLLTLSLIRQLCSRWLWTYFV